eukprot:1845368-Rhodomonas_salina.1
MRTQIKKGKCSVIASGVGLCISLSDVHHRCTLRAVWTTSTACLRLMCGLPSYILQRARCPSERAAGDPGLAAGPLPRREYPCCWARCLRLQGRI